MEGDYIPKSHRFERDMDNDNTPRRSDTLIFDDNSNSHYIHHDINALMKDQKMLESMLDNFLSVQKERLEILEKYSNGENAGILSGVRRIEKSKADYRMRHNLGGYVSNFITGFILGRPVTIEFKEDEEMQNGFEDDLETIKQISTTNNLQSLDFDLAFDASRYGRAFELHRYNSETGQDEIHLIDPIEIFVIREATVSKEMIGAVHCPIYNDEVFVTIYTAERIYKYPPFKVGQAKLSNPKISKHVYGDVPVVEWFNNRYRTGDFENVISLIDAYDASQSDTANYMSDLNDATLVIKVDSIESIGGQGGAKAMADANIVVLENGMDSSGRQTQGDAHYIYKQYDVQGAEAYKDRILNDIFKLSNVPNLDDDRFYSGQSGIALQYKLIGLRQIQARKEEYYKNAIRRRWQLIGNMHKYLYNNPIDANNLEITFHPNIPEDVWGEVKSYTEAGGVLSQETLRTLASFTDQITEETRLKLEEENNPRPDLADIDLYGGGMSESIITEAEKVVRARTGGNESMD